LKFTYKEKDLIIWTVSSTIGRPCVSAAAWLLSPNPTLPNPEWLAWLGYELHRAGVLNLPVYHPYEFGIMEEWYWPKKLLLWGCKEYLAREG